MSDEPPPGKTFSEDTVAVLLMATGCVSISAAQYAMMSSLDGTKTASSFQHQFRSVLKKAKELKARVDGRETFRAVAPAKKRGLPTDTATPPSTPKKPKANPKPRKKAAKPATAEDKDKYIQDPDIAHDKFTNSAFEDAFPFDMDGIVKAETDDEDGEDGLESAFI